MAVEKEQVTLRALGVSLNGILPDKYKLELQGGDLGTTSLNKYKDELELFKSHRIDFTTFCDYLLKSIQK